MNAYDVTALGEILIDFIPDGTDAMGDIRLLRKPGGAPLNFLAAVASGGFRTALIGKVGRDLPGDFLRRTVQRCGIDSTRLLTDDTHNTTLAFVELDASGDRQFSFYRAHGADRQITRAEVDADLIRASRIFHFGSLSLTDEPSRDATQYAVRLAKESGCTITYDPNYRSPLWPDEAQAVEQMSDLLPFVDILKISVEELAMLSGKAEMADGVQAMHSKGIRLVLVTDGARGAYVSMDGACVHIPPYPAQTVDTTGAGDIFFGTFVRAMLSSGVRMQNMTVDDACAFARAAAETAGKSTECYGALSYFLKE